MMYPGNIPELVKDELRCRLEFMSGEWKERTRAIYKARDRFQKVRLNKEDATGAINSVLKETSDLVSSVLEFFDLCRYGGIYDDESLQTVIKLSERVAYTADWIKLCKEEKECSH